MKNIILSVLFIFCTVVAKSQTAKADSIRQAEADSIVKVVELKTPIVVFREWLFKNITAEKFVEFQQLYDAYLRKEYLERIKKK